MMRKQLYSLRLLIDKTNHRERYLMLVVIAALILALTQGILILTGLDKHDKLQARIETKQRETQLMEQALLDYQAAINNPRVSVLQSKNEDLLERIATLEQSIDDINEKLMSPNRMISLVKELLDEQDDLTVLTFNVLPIQTIESNVDGGNLFYQHGLNMTLEGSYEALTEYLAAIESLEHQLFWDDLIVETDRFPVLTIQLKVHTLSQDKEWLNV